MHLIYVNEIGSDYKGQKQYEFIFSESVDIDMEEWFIIPSTSTSYSKSPDIQYVDVVGVLKDTDLNMDLVQDSDYFGVIDAVDNVIALAWEKFDFNVEVERLTFKFGESIESVTKKLKKRGFVLIKNEVKLKDI